MSYIEFSDKVVISGLRDLPAGARFSHAISLLDPQFQPEGLDEVLAGAVYHQARFHDEIEPIDGKTLPTPHDIEIILRFGRSIEFARDETRLFIHCHSGVSRSTAVAAIILAQAFPHMGGDEIVRWVATARPIAWPNTLMLRMAEDALDAPGKLTLPMLDHFRRRVAAEEGLRERMVRLRRSADLQAAGLLAAPEAKPSTPELTHICKAGMAQAQH